MPSSSASLTDRLLDTGAAVLVSNVGLVDSEITNNLPVPGFSTAGLHNEYKSPDITNLHSAQPHLSAPYPSPLVRSPRPWSRR